MGSSKRTIPLPPNWRGLLGLSYVPSKNVETKTKLAKFLSSDWELSALFFPSPSLQRSYILFCFESPCGQIKSVIEKMEEERAQKQYWTLSDTCAFSNKNSRYAATERGVRIFKKKILGKDDNKIKSKKAIESLYCRWLRPWNRVSPNNFSSCTRRLKVGGKTRGRMKDTMLKYT